MTLMKMLGGGGGERLLAAFVIMTVAFTSLTACVTFESLDSDAGNTTTEPANYITVSGVAGANERYGTFTDLYNDLKGKMKTALNGGDDIYGEEAVSSENAEKFKTFFTDNQGTAVDYDAKITYTIHGTVEYDEKDLSYLLSLGRAASRFSDTLHLSHFEIEGADADAVLKLNSKFTLPYQWWGNGTGGGDTHWVFLTLDNINIVNGTINDFSIGQAFICGIGVTMRNVNVSGLSYGMDVDSSYSFTATGCTFDANGNKNVGNYALQLMGFEEYKDKDGKTLVAATEKRAKITMSGCEFTGYPRGVNIHQATAEATIENCRISNTDSGRSAIQITECSKITIKGCTINVVGNAFTLHENLKKSLELGSVSINITNNTINNVSKGTLGAHLVYSEINGEGGAAGIGNFEELFSEKAKITFTSNWVDPTVKIEKRVYKETESDVPTFILNSLNFKVFFDANGHGTAPSTVEVGYGKTITDLAELSAEGYVFEGWYTDSGLTKSFGSADAIYGQTTLYAKWSIQILTVSFIVNGQDASSDATVAERGSVSSEELSVPYGTAVSAKSNVLTVGENDVTATASEGYAFISWSGVPAGSTVTSDVTITALFMKTEGDDKAEVETDTAKIVVEKTEGTASIVSEIKTDTTDVDTAISETLAKIEEVKTASGTSTEDAVVQVVVPLAENTNELEISTETVTALKESGAELTVSNEGTTVTLEAKVIETLAQTPASQSGDSLSIKVTPKTSELSDAQKTVVGDNQAVDVSAYLGDNKVSDLGGKATISVPYETTKKVKVTYVKDDGTTENVDCTYVDGVVSFVTTHFSVYMISEIEETVPDDHKSPTFIIIPDTSQDDFPGYIPQPDADSDSGEDQTTEVAIIAGAIAVVLVAIVALVHKSR